MLGFNSLAPGRCECNIKLAIFKLKSRIDFLSIFCEIALRRMHWFNIGSGNGLLPSGNKPLTEPVLTQIYGAIWLHYATTS